MLFLKNWTLLDKISFLVFVVSGFILAYNTEGFTGDYDSIYHLLVAEEGFNSPELLFNLWGKPIFNLIMVFPAHLFWYKGIVFMNMVFLMFSLVLVHSLAKKWKLKPTWFIFLFPFLVRAMFPYTCSALTEPLSGFLFISIVYTIANGRMIPFYLLCSVIYLSRYELIFLIPVALFIGVLKKDKRVLLVFVGPLIFELTSHFIFNTPLGHSLFGGYKTGVSVYGSRPWDHMLLRLHGMLGSWVFLVGFLISTTFLFVYSINKIWVKLTNTRSAILLLSAVPLGILTLHVIVSSFGVFASAGMGRVLMPFFAAIPLIILLSIKSFSLKVRNIILIFLFSSNLLAIYGFSFLQTKNYYALSLEKSDLQKIVAHAECFKELDRNAPFFTNLIEVSLELQVNVKKAKNALVSLEVIKKEIDNLPGNFVMIMKKSTQGQFIKHFRELEDVICAFEEGDYYLVYIKKG